MSGVANKSSPALKKVSVSHWGLKDLKVFGKSKIIFCLFNF